MIVQTTADFGVVLERRFHLELHKLAVVARHRLAIHTKLDVVGALESTLVFFF